MDQSTIMRSSIEDIRTTSFTIGISACGSPPQITMPARSAKPLALSRSARSLSDSRSAMVCVIIT
ncbi:hypothetical protein ACFQY7_36385 [Actinomadura luteofluorescens]|uniref:hypothetical protein n=1 Tax=Actinomadura luteofluorescens TaxID=46163 RepID=UPI00363397C8